MEVDNLFKSIERRSERQLYNQTFRSITKSEQQLLKQFSNKKAELRKANFAREFLWFFLALFLAPVIGLLIFLMLTEFVPYALTDAIEVFGAIDSFFYFCCTICFIGVYITRVTVWALSKL